MRLTYVAVAVMLAACADPVATPGSSLEGAGSLPAPTEPTATAGSTAPLPPMPAGFPLHPSMEEIKPDPDAIAAWSADAAPQDVYAFYLRELEEAGFVIDLEAPGGAAALLRFSAPDGTPYQLDMTGDGPVTLQLGPPHR